MKKLALPVLAIALLSVVPYAQVGAPLSPGTISQFSGNGSGGPFITINCNGSTGTSSQVLQGGNPCTWTGSPVLSTSLTNPLLIGGSAADSALEFRASSNTTSSTTPFTWAAGNNGATILAKLFSTGIFAVSNSGPVNTSLGSGGTFISAINTSSSGGFQAASNLTASGSDVGYLDFGTFGTAGGEKRSAAIHSFLSAASGTTVTGELRLYTTNAGTIAEKLRVAAGGLITVVNSLGFGAAGSGVLSDSATAPTIASGGCTSPAVTHNNGTTAFLITIGTSCTGVKSFTLTMPASAHFWACDGNNNTSDAAQQSNYIVFRATSTTAVVGTSYDRVTGLQEDFTASDTYLVKCRAE